MHLKHLDHNYNIYVYDPGADPSLPLAAHSMSAAQRAHERQLARDAFNPIIADLLNNFVPAPQQVTQHNRIALSESPAGHRLHTVAHASSGSGAMPYASIAAVHTTMPKWSDLPCSKLQQCPLWDPILLTSTFQAVPPRGQ